jgi:hypothetical protein
MRNPDLRKALLGLAVLATLAACSSSVNAPPIPSRGTVPTATPTAGPASSGSVSLGSSPATSTLSVPGDGSEALTFAAVAGGGKLNLAASQGAPAGLTPLSVAGSRTQARLHAQSVVVTPFLYTTITNAGTGTLTIPVPTILYTAASAITGTYALYYNAGSGWVQAATATASNSATLQFNPQVASVAIAGGSSITIALASVVASQPQSGPQLLPGQGTLLAGQSTVIGVSEIGAQSFTTAVKGGATVAPAGPISGGQQYFNVTAVSAGSATVTITDDAKQSATFTLTVLPAAATTVVASTATAQNLPAATGVTNPQVTIAGGGPAGKKIVVADTAGAAGPAGLPALPSPLLVNSETATPIFGLEGTTLSDATGAGASAVTTTSVSGFSVSVTLPAAPAAGTPFSVLFYTPPIPPALPGGWALAAGSSCSFTGATVTCQLPLGSSTVPFQLPGGLNFGLEIAQVAQPAPSGSSIVLQRGGTPITALSLPLGTDAELTASEAGYSGTFNVAVTPATSIGNIGQNVAVNPASAASTNGAPVNLAVGALAVNSANTITVSDGNGRQTTLAASVTSNANATVLGLPTTAGVKLNGDNDGANLGLPGSGAHGFIGVGALGASFGSFPTPSLPAGATVLDVISATMLTNVTLGSSVSFSVNVPSGMSNFGEEVYLPSLGGASLPGIVQGAWNPNPSSGACVAGGATLTCTFAPGATLGAVPIPAGAQIGFVVYATPAAPALHLYETDTQNAVNIIQSNANGAVVPSQLLGNAAEPFVPNFLGQDATNSLYLAVQNYAGSNITEGVAVFAPGATGSATPVRSFSTGELQNINYLAVAPDGTVYSQQTPGAGGLTVFPPAASGLFPPNSQLSAPPNTTLGAVAIPPDGSIFVYAVKSNPLVFEILKYPAGSIGSATPSAVITGPNTGLQDSRGGSTFVAMAVDHNDNIYVLLSTFDPSSNGFHGSVEVFAAGSSGNATPIATIAGKNTMLYGLVGSSLTVDPAGNIFVAGPPGSGAIYVFNAGANGNVAPARTITGSGILSPASVLVGP